MAYAIQTSGTTGKPKVVQVPHGCIVPNILQLRDIFAVGPCDTVFLSSPITFDPSVVETFITLTSGACLLIAPESIRSAPGPLLFQFLFGKPRKCGRVTVLSLTPSYAACLLCSGDITSSIVKEMRPDLNVLCLGGEPCPVTTTLEQWINKLGKRTRVFSLYGITEVSCWASIAEVSFVGKQHAKHSVKRKEDDTLVRIEPKHKSMKLDKQESEDQDHMGNTASSERAMTERMNEIKVLPKDCLDANVVNKCSSLEHQPFGVYQELFEASSSARNILEIPLGTPMAETILEVRDFSGHTVCHGEGELFIGSETRICLLDGETIDTLEKGEVVFRATGDIVQVENLVDQLNQSSSVMYYRGRRDGAVKRFGKWIFVESVEAAASKFQWNCGTKMIAVASVSCVSCGKETGRGRLGLFVVPSEKDIFREPESQPAKKKFVEDLASHLTGVLPTNSWPDVILPIDELPLSKHGKVDRENLKGRLKDLSEVSIKNKRKPSMTPDELLLNFKSLWMRYLKINREPSSSDEFLLSGGDSLSALRLVAELEDSSNCAISPKLLIKLINGTYEEACACICTSESTGLQSGKTGSSLALKGESELVVDLRSSGNSAEVPYSVHEPAKFQGDNICGNINVHLCTEFTRGKIVKHQLSSKMFSAHLTVGKSPAIAEKWKYHLVKCVDASPVVLQYTDLESIVVVGSHSGILAAVNLETGHQVFRCVLPDRIESSACSSPCGKFLFVGCYDHRLYCISVPEGKVMWSFTTEDIVKCSPLIANHGTSVVFGSYSGNIYCIDIKGDLLWKTKLRDGPIYSSPALYQELVIPEKLGGEYKTENASIEGSDSTSVNNGIIICATLGGTCVALTEKEGRILWKSELKAPIFTSPLVYGCHVVISSVKGRVAGFMVKSGEMIWSFQAGGNVFSSFTAVEANDSWSIVFGCHDHYVYCVNGDGVLQWRTMVDSPIFATPFIFPVSFCSALENEELCSSDWNGFTSHLVAIGSTAGSLYILDTLKGTVVVTMNVDGQIFSSPAVYQNHIIFGCRDNFLYCFTIV
ncbi:beta-alanine-activating enzyme [Hetaerina americana]|uniref:beta-alanine-activating enzyme n=1 Tax=Hetaerina americana TaxID=62018 RepID=UPI003A7F13A5